MPVDFHADNDGVKKKYIIAAIVIISVIVYTYLARFASDSAVCALIYVHNIQRLNSHEFNVRSSNIRYLEKLYFSTCVPSALLRLVRRYDFHIPVLNANSHG